MSQEPIWASTQTHEKDRTSSPLCETTVRACSLASHSLGVVSCTMNDRIALASSPSLHYNNLSALDGTLTYSHLSQVISGHVEALLRLTQTLIRLTGSSCLQAISLDISSPSKFTSVKLQVRQPAKASLPTDIFLHEKHMACRKRTQPSSKPVFSKLKTCVSQCLPLARAYKSGTLVHSNSFIAGTFAQKLNKVLSHLYVEALRCYK